MEYLIGFSIIVNLILWGVAMQFVIDIKDRLIILEYLARGVMSCGHPQSAVVQAKDGTAWCRMCETEAHEPPVS